MIGDRRPTARPAMRADASDVQILGVRILNMDKSQAARLIWSWARSGDGRPRAVFIVNAHTLTLAETDPSYRAVLNRADAVFGDGVGVRVAARLRGVEMRDNLVGTDLMPFLFAQPFGERLRYFLLGGTPETAAGAAAGLRERFPALDLAGYHHGYFEEKEAAPVIESINEAAPDVLLIGMGNPRQERWIHDHLAALRVPVSIGVGGLFDHWSGRLRRAPRWARQRGLEWCQILFQQPHKWRRYLLGGPRYAAWVVRRASLERRIGGEGQWAT